MTAANRETSRLRRYLPFLGWLPGYQRVWLRPDFLAGLTVVALLIPEGMAYAELAGMPPETAFYAAPAGLLLYAIFGTSRQLVVAVSSAVAVMSASIIGVLAAPGSQDFFVLTAGLAFLAGLFAILGGLLRLGRVARFFSESILVGFIFGLALVIAMKQLPKIFGIEAGSGNFWQRTIHLIQHLDETHLVTLLVGSACLVLMIVIERRFHRVPAALVTLLFGIAVSVLFNLEALGVHVVGAIPAGLTTPRIPPLALSQWLILVPGALGIVLVAFAEAIGPAREFAASHDHAIDEDQEMIGLGAANLGAGLFQGFSIGSSLSKSAANEAAGARTQVSGMIAAGVTMLVALFLTGLFAPLPEATLAAIVVVAIAGMFKIKQMRRLYRLNRADFALALATFLGVLTFHESLTALLFGVTLALVVLVARASQSRLSVLGREPGRMVFHSLERHPESKSVPGLLVLRPEHGLYFANSSGLRQEVRDRLAAWPAPARWVLLDLELTAELDVPTVEVLLDLFEDLEKAGVTLFIVNVHGKVRDLLERGGATEKIGVRHISPAGLNEAIYDYVRENSDIPLELSDSIEDGLAKARALVEAHLPHASGSERRRLEELGRLLEDMKPPP